MSEYNIAIADDIHDVVILLNTTTNVSVNVSVPNVVAVSRAYDGSGNIIATAGKNIYVINGVTGDVENMFATGAGFDLSNCRKTLTNYWCGSKGVQKTSWVYKLDLNGVLLNSYSVGNTWAVAPPSNRYAFVDVDTTHEVVYVTAYDTSAGDKYELDTYDIDGGGWTLIGRIEGIGDKNADTIFGMEYHPEIDGMEIGYLNDYDLWNRSANYSFSATYSTITATHGNMPTRTSTASYLSYDFGTGTFYQDDGIPNHLYTLALNLTLTNFNNERYTEIYTETKMGLVEIRASEGAGVCGAMDSAVAVCTFTRGGNSWIITADDDQSTTSTTEVGLDPQSQVVEGTIPTNIIDKTYFGWLKPHNICWSTENTKGVGASGLHSIRAFEVYNQGTAQTGFEMGIFTENMRWGDIIGWHWHTSVTPESLFLGVPCATDPTIMAGGYASPLVLSFIPDLTLVNTSNMQFNYSFGSPDVTNWEYLANFTEDGINIALPFNNSHYIRWNITHNDTMEGYNYNYSILNWTQLRAELVAFDSDLVPSIVDLLTITPMDTQTYQYIQSTGEVRAYGYVWTNISKRWEDYPSTPCSVDWPINDGIHPKCADNTHLNYSMFAYKVNADFIRFRDVDRVFFPYPSLLQMPENVVGQWYLAMFNLEVYPTLTTTTREDLYSEGIGYLPIGAYNVSCIAEDGQELTWENWIVREQGTNFLMADKFDTSTDVQVGLDIRVEDRAGNPVEYGTCQFQSGSYEQTAPISDGWCYAYDVPTNSYMNITLTKGNFVSHHIRYINDQWNSGAGTLSGLPQGEGGTCATFLTYPSYIYTLVLNPNLYERTLRVTCNNYGIPTADVWINNVPYGTTDGDGQLIVELADLTSEIEGGFRIDILSDYGNWSGTIANFNNDPTIVALQNCDVDRLMNEGATSYVDMGSTIAFLTNPMFIVLLVCIGGAISVSVLSKSTEIGLMFFAGGISIFSLLGVIPLFVMALLIVVVALIFAHKFKII